MRDGIEGLGRRRPPAVDVALAVLAGALVLALGAAGVARSRAVAVERRATADEAALGEVSVALAADLERGLVRVAAAAVAVPSAGLGAVSDAGVPGADRTGFVPVSGALPDTAGPLILPPPVRDDPVVGAVLDRARDSGAPEIGGPADLGAGPRLLTVAAVYGAGASPGPPTTSVERRARLAGWVVAPVDPERLAQAAAPAGTTAWVEHGGLRLTGGAEDEPIDVGRDLPQRVVELAGQALTVRAGTVDPVALSGPTVALATASVVLAAVAATATLVGARRIRALGAAAERRGAQVQLIGDVAPIVQQSLELGEVLPAVAVQLTDHFGLAGVSLSTGSTRSGQTEVFGLGAEPDPTAKAVLRPPGALAAGDTLTLALQRGGRSVALLQIVAGRALDAGELESLRALTELVTAALVNASLYASQQEALGRLRDLDALKTVFLGTASHELRTPVTAISGFAALLAGSWDRFDEVERRDFATRIASNARALAAVVQDLLDFSLLDRGMLEVALEPLELGPVVASVVDRLEPLFDEHDIRCATVRTDPVAADRNSVERVTTNLLANAVKFSPPGSTVLVSVEPAAGGAALVVADEGPGVPTDERERVFTRFYRGSGDAVVQTRGVGIGLSVVAELVTRMQGEVSVDDAPGGGARFTVRLVAAHPLAEAEGS